MHITRTYNDMCVCLLLNCTLLPAAVHDSTVYRYSTLADQTVQLHPKSPPSALSFPLACAWLWWTSNLLSSQFHSSSWCFSLQLRIISLQTWSPIPAFRPWFSSWLLPTPSICLHVIVYLDITGLIWLHQSELTGWRHWSTRLLAWHNRQFRYVCVVVGAAGFYKLLFPS
jgi:hypothetical protein